MGHKQNQVPFVGKNFYSTNQQGSDDVFGEVPNVFEISLFNEHAVSHWFWRQTSKKLANFSQVFCRHPNCKAHRIAKVSDNFSDQRWRNNLLKIGWVAIIGFNFSTNNAIFELQTAHLIIQLISQTKQSVKIVAFWNIVLFYPTTNMFERLICFFCLKKRIEWFLINDFFRVFLFPEQAKAVRLFAPMKFKMFLGWAMRT